MRSPLRIFYWEIYEFFKTAEAANGGALYKGVHKNFTIFLMKTPVLESLWRPLGMQLY